MRKSIHVISVAMMAILCALPLNAKTKHRKPIQPTEEWEFVAIEEFKKQRDVFIAEDSSLVVLHDLGNAAKLESWMPQTIRKRHWFKYPYGIMFKPSMLGTSVGYEPCANNCVDTLSMAFTWTEHAVAVHKNLDSALVKVKRRAVARLFMRAMHTVWESAQDNEQDTAKYSGIYEYYMRKAKFECIAVNQDRKKNYIVYAIISVPSMDAKRTREEFETKFKYYMK